MFAHFFCYLLGFYACEFPEKKEKNLDVYSWTKVLCIPKFRAKNIIVYRSFLKSKYASNHGYNRYTQWPTNHYATPDPINIP